MKILFLASYYPNKFSGEGPFMREHAKALAVKNEVTVIGIKDFSDPEGPIFFIDTNLFNERLTEVIVYYNTSINGIYPLKSLFRFARLFIGVYRAWSRYGRNSAKTLLNVVRPLGVFALFLRLFGYRYSILEHSTGFVIDEYRQSSVANKLLHKTCFKHADFQFVVSDFLGQALVREGLINRFKIIPNVIDSVKFKPLSSASKENSTKKLLHISNFASWKRVDNILEAVRLISRERTDFHLYLVGVGPNSTYIENLVATKDLTAYVTMKGFIPHDQLNEFINECDFLVMDSLHETFGCVLYECLSSGIPVLAPSMGAIPENFIPAFGLLHKNQEELVQNISMMLETCRSYSADYLHSEITNRFSVTVVSNKFENLWLGTVSFSEP